MLTRLCVFLNTQVQPVQSLLSVLSSMIPEPKGMSCIVDFINWDQVLQLYFDWLCFFFNGLHLLQRKVSLMGVKTTLICGYEHKYLECNWGLCLFSKMVVIGSPSRPMTSLALGSCLGFWYQT